MTERLMAPPPLIPPAASFGDDDTTAAAAVADTSRSSSRSSSSSPSPNPSLRHPADEAMRTHTHALEGGEEAALASSSNSNSSRQAATPLSEQRTLCSDAPRPHTLSRPPSFTEHRINGNRKVLSPAGTARQLSLSLALSRASSAADAASGTPTPSLSLPAVLSPPSSHPRSPSASSTSPSTSTPHPPAAQRLSPSETQRRLLVHQLLTSLPPDHPYLRSFSEQMTAALGVEESFEEAREQIPPRIDLATLAQDALASAMAAAATPGAMAAALAASAASGGGTGGAVPTPQGITPRPTHRHRRTLSNQITIVPALYGGLSAGTGTGSGGTPNLSNFNTPNLLSTPYPPIGSSLMSLTYSPLPSSAFSALASAVQDPSPRPFSPPTRGRSLPFLSVRRQSEGGNFTMQHAAAAASAATNISAGASTVVSAAVSSTPTPTLRSPIHSSQPTPLVSSTPSSAAVATAAASLLPSHASAHRYSDHNPEWVSYSRAWESQHHLFDSLRRVGHPPHYSRSFFWNHRDESARTSQMSPPPPSRSPQPVQQSQAYPPSSSFSSSSSSSSSPPAPSYGHRHARRSSTNMLAPDHGSGDVAAIAHAPGTAGGPFSLGGGSLHQANQAAAAAAAASLAASSSSGLSNLLRHLHGASKRSTMPSMHSPSPSPPPLMASPTGSGGAGSGLPHLTGGLPPPHTRLTASPQPAGADRSRRGSLSSRTNLLAAPITGAGVSAFASSMPVSPSPSSLLLPVSPQPPSEFSMPAAALPGGDAPTAAADGTFLAMMRAASTATAATAAAASSAGTGPTVPASSSLPPSTSSPSALSTPLSPSQSAFLASLTLHGASLGSWVCSPPPSAVSASLQQLPYRLSILSEIAVGGGGGGSSTAESSPTKHHESDTPPATSRSPVEDSTLTTAASL